MPGEHVDLDRHGRDPRHDRGRADHGLAIAGHAWTPHRGLVPFARHGARQGALGFVARESR
jgi:hypothetical protein